MLVLWCGCAELGAYLPSVVQQPGGLTEGEIIQGLKEALTVGAGNAVSSASAVDGFLGDPRLYIPFPPDAIKVKNALEQAGFSNLTADFEKSLNRAAEEAAKSALPIFRNAVAAMTITDAVDILHGPDNAATQYLRSKTEADLRVEFTPIVRNALQTVKVASYWNPVASAYNATARLTGAATVNPDIEGYVTGKTLDGLFLLIAQEEQKIRQDPAARVTDILRKVFGSSQG